MQPSRCDVRSRQVILQRYFDAIEVRAHPLQENHGLCLESLLPTRGNAHAGYVMSGTLHPPPLTTPSDSTPTFPWLASCSIGPDWRRALAGTRRLRHGNKVARRRVSSLEMRDGR